MINPERQREVQDIAGSVIDETLARLVRCGIAPHEIAQVMVMTGAGLLAGSLGPKHAAYELRAVSEAVGNWIENIAVKLESRETN